MLKQLTRAKSQSNELTKWTRSLDSHVPGAHMEIDARAHMEFACGPTYCFMVWCPVSHHNPDACLLTYIFMMGQLACQSFCRARTMSSHCNNRSNRQPCMKSRLFSEDEVQGISMSVGVKLQCQ